MIKSVARIFVLFSLAFSLGIGFTFAPPAESAQEWGCESTVHWDQGIFWFDELCHPFETTCCHRYTHECTTTTGYVCEPMSE